MKPRTAAPTKMTTLESLEPRLFLAGDAPAPQMEIDTFANSYVSLWIQLPTGAMEPIGLSGTSTWEVAIPPSGAAGDPDGDGLDDVAARLTQLDVAGSSSLGPVTVQLSPGMPGVGGIEEEYNYTAGILDVPPFAPTGAAVSFFDVFLDITLQAPGGPIVMRTAMPVRMSATIWHKPPFLGETYTSDQGPIPLVDLNGQPTGVFLLNPMYAPEPLQVEMDSFDQSMMNFNLLMPDGSGMPVNLTGPTQWEVYIPPSGQAIDRDGNGLDEADAQMYDMQLSGASPLGPVSVRVTPGSYGWGQIEEQVNNTPGILDVPPFTATGMASSFFDVYLDVTIGDTTYHTAVPIDLQALISHKPPAEGETYYGAKQPIPLLDANGNPTGIFLAGATYTPTGQPPVPVENDFFDQSEVSAGLLMPDGSVVPLDLWGPSAWEVWTSPDGVAADLDGDGLDQVVAQLTQLEVSGASLFGPVMATLTGGMPANGEIEEQVNNTPGILDVPPFTPVGTVDSFFDVYLDIQIGEMVFHTATPVPWLARLTHKPAAPGETYVSPAGPPVPLLDPMGNPTGLFLVDPRYTPEPERPEFDFFDSSQAALLVQLPDGTLTQISLAGPTEWEVFIPPTGAAADTDGDGLDQVASEMLMMDLSGPSADVGWVYVTLTPGTMSTGEIEEQVNNTPGILDVPPFTPVGMATSFFDVFLDITIGDVTFHTASPVRLSGSISHKPPAPGEMFFSLSEPMELLDVDGNPSGLWLTDSIYVPVPGPPPELDYFDASTATAGILLPDGSVMRAALSGPSAWEVWIQPDGAASDTDGNGLDQVETEMLQLDLTGFSPVAGPISVALTPGTMSTGQIEERVNNTPGVLDVPPFMATGMASSFFDVWIDITVGGATLHTASPVHLEGVISHKPPMPGEMFFSTPSPVALLDADGNPTGLFLVNSTYTPVPPPECVWTGGFSDVWEDPGNWLGGEVPGPASVAVFDRPAPFQPRLYTDETVRGVDFRTMNWTIGGAPWTLTVGDVGIDCSSGAAGTIVSSVALATGSTWSVDAGGGIYVIGTVSGAGQFLGKDGAGKLVARRVVDAGALLIGEGTLMIGMDRSTSTTNLLKIATDPTGMATAKLDVTNGSLVIDYTGQPNPLEDVKRWVLQAYDGMAWDGLGITSTSAAIDPITYGVGLADNAHPDMLMPYGDGISAPLFGNVTPVPVNPESVLVKYTYNGDINLDGQVDDNDVTLLNLFYDGGAATNRAWFQGDIAFNDGMCDDNDVTFLNLTYRLGLGDPLGGAPVLLAVAPQPPARGADLTGLAIVTSDSGADNLLTVESEAEADPSSILAGAAKVRPTSDAVALLDEAAGLLMLSA